MRIRRDRDVARLVKKILSCPTDQDSLYEIGFVLSYEQSDAYDAYEYICDVLLDSRKDLFVCVIDRDIWTFSGSKREVIRALKKALKIEQKKAVEVIALQEEMEAGF